MARQKSPAYQFYPEAILSDEEYLLMNWTTRGVYRHCLDLAWVNRGIPSDAQLLRVMCHYNGRNWTKVYAAIRSKFCLLEGDPSRMSNERLEREREKQQRFREKQTVNGRKGGRPKQNPDLTHGLAKRNPNETQAKPLYTVVSKYVSTSKNVTGCEKPKPFLTPPGQAAGGSAPERATPPAQLTEPEALAQDLGRHFSNPRPRVTL